jgi:hypothetical protein
LISRIKYSIFWHRGCGAIDDLDGLFTCKQSILVLVFHRTIVIPAPAHADLAAAERIYEQYIGHDYNGILLVYSYT